MMRIVNRYQSILIWLIIMMVDLMIIKLINRHYDRQHSFFHSIIVDHEQLIIIIHFVDMVIWLGSRKGCFRQETRHHLQSNDASNDASSLQARFTATRFHKPKGIVWSEPLEIDRCCSLLVYSPVIIVLAGNQCGYCKLMCSLNVNNSFIPY